MKDYIGKLLKPPKIKKYIVVRLSYFIKGYKQILLLENKTKICGNLKKITSTHNTLLILKKKFKKSRTN